MRKIKIFTHDSTSELEEAVNEWLTANWSVSIVEILQSESDRSLTISILYIGGDD